MPLRPGLTQFKRFLHSRFSPDEALGLYLTLGILILIGASWLFAAIAEDVVNKEQLTEIDGDVTQAVQAHGSRALTIAMLIITHAHSTPAGILITSVVVAYFVRNRLKSWALAFSVSVGGGMLLNASLKNLFQRARPTFEDPILTFTSYAFPSGHTMLATTLYGVLCVFLVSRVHSWRWRLLIIIVAVLLIGLVGFSRIYLGAHHLSDVMAAMVEGLAWVALCLTAVHTRRRWKEQRQNKADEFLDTV